MTEHGTLFYIEKIQINIIISKKNIFIVARLIKVFIGHVSIKKNNQMNQ